MNKSRGFALSLLTVMLAVALGALVACGQGTTQDNSSSSESFSVTSEPVQEEPPVVLRTDPFYVLVVGSDTRTGTAGIKEAVYADGNARSDTLMLVRVDPKKYQLTLLSIPRDTATEVNGATGKINDTYTVGGISELKKAVKNLTGVMPDYYLLCTFVTFQDLVNDMGGITVDVPIDQSMTDIVSGEHMEFPAGQQQTLDGAQALIFARERHAYDPNGEVYRQTNDRYIVRSMIEKILADPSLAAEAATKLYGDVETDWDARELAAYVADFMDNKKKVSFLSGTGPWYGDYDEASGKWLTVRDEETWAQVMDVVNNGGDPNEIIEPLSAY